MNNVNGNVVLQMASACHQAIGGGSACPAPSVLVFVGWRVCPAPDPITRRSIC